MMIEHYYQGAYIYDTTAGLMSLIGKSIVFSEYTKPSPRHRPAAISVLNAASDPRHFPADAPTSSPATATAMAASSRLAILFALLAASSALASAQKGSKAKPAAGPAGDAAADSAPPTDLSKELGGPTGQYSKFLQLLHDTRVDDQIKAQLTDSYNGLTIFAPTNAAFDKLKSGTLNGLSSQDQIQLVLYCVLPRFYSLPMLGGLNGKVTTQGSGHDGPYKYDIKRAGDNVNVSTGVNSMLLGSPLSKEFPLAVYPVDKVPLPYEMFGPKPPTPAPAPAPAPTKSKTKAKKHKKSAGIADPPVADDSTADDEEKSAAAAGAGVARWVAALGVIGGAVLSGLF